MDEQRKRELRRQYKARERAEARRRMCLHSDQLNSLLSYLGEQLFGLGIACDHSLDRTRIWAEQEGLDPEAILESVRAFGGFCDCEVVYNVRPGLFGWEE
jgi:hypothetical protein